MRMQQNSIEVLRMTRIDEESLRKILAEYQKENKLIFPDKMALDSKQEQFVRGYLCAQQNETEDYETDDEEIRRQILQVRSKYCDPILKLLFQEKELYHGDLADNLKMSPSGLTAIIKKMMEQEPPIIEMTQIGKYTIYNLPDRVRRYMERRDGYKDSKATGGEAYGINVLLPLQHFVAAAGMEWRDELNLLLQKRDSESSVEDKNYFTELIERAKEAKRFDSRAYDELKKVIQNDILWYLLDGYVNDLEECEQIMEEIRQRENGEKLVRYFAVQ